MEGKRDYAKEIHESIRIYRQNRDLEAENEKLRNEITGLEYILRERNNTIDEIEKEKQISQKEEREKCHKIVDILNRLNKKIDEIPIKKNN